MPCETKDLGGGSFAIVCSKGSGARCAYCSNRGTQLCDFPVTRNGKKGTCDVRLCTRCSTKIAGDGDLCRAHAPLWDSALGKPKVGPGTEPKAEGRS